MGVSNNSPTFSYVHFSGVSVVYNNELYMVQDYATNKKYIYYNVDLPNQLNSSNVMPNRSLKQFLVAINDNGMATLVPSTSDDFSISFDGNSTQAIKDRIFGLYEKNEQFGEKFVAIEQDINGIKQIVGEGGVGGEGYDDSAVWEKISQIEQTAEKIDLSVKETTKKYNDDKETNQLRENLNSSIIKINSNLGTFKSEITTYFKNNEITEEETIQINTQLGILENEKVTLDGYVDTVKLVAEKNNQTQDVVAIESAKRALDIAHNNLKNNISNAIIDSIITSTENTIIIDSFAKYNLRLNELKKTCDDIIILGLGGVITEELANISIKSDEIRLSVSKVESDFKNDMSVQKIEIESQIKDVSNALGTFENTVNTVFKDGIIDEAEKILLQEKIDSIDKEKLDVDAKYNSVVNDENLSEDIKTELVTKYEEYNDKHSELKSKIEYVISDSMVNDAEKLEINTLFKEYANVLAYFSALMTKAVEDITFNTAKVELEQAKNDLKVEIDDVKDSIAGIGGIIDGTFEDNILDEVERKNIEQNLENLSRERIDIDNTYNSMYASEYLLGQSKEHFKIVYDEYVDAFNEVVSVSTGILNKETLIDNVDRANLDSAILAHKDKLNLLSIETNKVMDIIALNKSNALKGDMQQEISDVNNRIDDVLGDISGAIGDGIIDEAEAIIIKNSLDNIKKEKLDVDAKYSVIYENECLNGEVKTNLIQAKNEFDIVIENLISTITTIIEDNKVTDDESILLEESKQGYMEKSAILNTRFQEAIDYISKTQVDKAKEQFQKEINDLGGVLSELENTMNGAFQDGILTEAEKLSIKQHLLTLSSEKSDVDKQYQTIYTNEYLKGDPKTNLTTAYKNYVSAYNSLVTIINNMLEKEGLIDSVDRNNLNNAFKQHDTKLGLYTESATNALDAIAKKKIDESEEKTNKKIADIIIDTESITSRVGSIESTTTTLADKFDNLEIGSRNYLPNTDFSDSTNLEKWYCNTHSVNSFNVYENFGANLDKDSFIRGDYVLRNRHDIANAISLGKAYSMFRASDVVLEKNTEYTISFYMYKSGNCGKCLMNVFTVLEDGSLGTKCGGTSSITEYTGAFEKHTVTFTTNAESNKFSVRFYNYYKDTLTSGYSDVHIYHPMLAKGNKAMDWTTAPEDTKEKLVSQETRISSAEQKITDKAITSVVQESEFIKDIDGKISTNKSNISKVEQTASKINSTVSDLSGRYTELNQTVSGLTSKVADKVNSSDISSIIQQSSKDIQIGFNGINDRININERSMDFIASNGNRDMLLYGGQTCIYNNMDNTFMATMGSVLNNSNTNKGTGFLLGKNCDAFVIGRDATWTDILDNRSPNPLGTFFINFKDNYLGSKGIHLRDTTYTTNDIVGMNNPSVHGFYSIGSTNTAFDVWRSLVDNTIVMRFDGGTNKIKLGKVLDGNGYVAENFGSINTSRLYIDNIYAYNGNYGKLLMRTDGWNMYNGVNWDWYGHNLLNPVIIGGSYGYSITPNTDTYSNVKTCNDDVNLDGVLDKINIYPTRTTYETDLATCKTNSEISLEIDVTELKQSENADMFIKKYSTVNSETGENEIVENIDMKSMLHLALLEIKKLKKEVKELKQKAGV